MKHYFVKREAFLVKYGDFEVENFTHEKGRYF